MHGQFVGRAHALLCAPPHRHQFVERTKRRVHDLPVCSESASLFSYAESGPWGLDTDDRWLHFVARGKRDQVAGRCPSCPELKRYPQFNKDALAESLNPHGIRYEHFPEMGGKRKSKPDSRNTAWRNASFRGYADYMGTRRSEKGIERLLDVAGQGAPAGQPPKENITAGKPSLLAPTAIMCAEAVWWRCHRSLIRIYVKRVGWKCARSRCKQNRAASLHIRSTGGVKRQVQLRSGVAVVGRF